MLEGCRNRDRRSIHTNGRNSGFIDAPNLPLGPASRPLLTRLLSLLSRPLSEAATDAADEPVAGVAGFLMKPYLSVSTRGVPILSARTFDTWVSVSSPAPTVAETQNRFH